jgi:hypothetical protein
MENIKRILKNRGEAMDKKYYTLEEMQKIKLKDGECWTAIGINQKGLDFIVVRYMIVKGN